MRQRSWRASATPITALGLGLLAGALRLPRALASSFWQDEVASARILDENSLGGVLRHVARTESTPPLWYVVAWFVHRLGVPVFDVRLLSVVEDALLVALVVVLAARILGVRHAALAGLLVALGAQFSAEGRWIRAYELLALLTVTLALVLLRSAANPSRPNLLLLAATVCAGSLTHYFFLLSLTGAIVWLLCEPEYRDGRRKLVLAIVTGLVPLLFWTPEWIAQVARRRYGWIGPFDGWEVLATPLRLFTSLGAGPWLSAGALLVLLALIWSSALLWDTGPTERLSIAMGTVPIVSAALLWAAGLRVYDVRNLIGVGPFIAIALAAGAAALPARANRAAVVGLTVAAVGSFALAQRTPVESYDKVARALVTAGWRPGDAVAILGSPGAFRSPLEWYLPGRPDLTKIAVLHVDEPLFVVRANRSSSQRVIFRMPLRERSELDGARIFLTSGRRPRARSRS